MEDINEIWIKITKQGINEEAGKIIEKGERPQRNSWFVKECQIILEGKKRAYNKMINWNTRQNEQEYKGTSKEAHNIFRQNREYCLNQSWSKWKLPIITIMQKNVTKKWIV